MYAYLLCSVSQVHYFAAGAAAALASIYWPEQQSCYLIGVLASPLLSASADAILLIGLARTQVGQC